MAELVLKWAMRYHALTVEIYGDVDEAVGAAGLAADNGEESLDRIEVLGDDGTVKRTITPEDMDDLLAPKREREYQEYQASVDAVTHIVEIAGPSGEWASWLSCSSLRDAEQEAARLRGFLGERVRIEAVG
jgi:cob(I)alamin adenosyltransferase